VAHFRVLMIHIDDKVNVTFSPKARGRPFSGNSRNEDHQLLMPMEVKMRAVAEGCAARYALVFGHNGSNHSAIAIVPDTMLADGAASEDKQHLLGELAALAAMSLSEVDDLTDTANALRRACVWIARYRDVARPRAALSTRIDGKRNIHGGKQQAN